MNISSAFAIFILLTLGSCLQKSILITRHGARSPKVYTEIDSTYYWTIQPEDLTEIGLQQHVNLGQSKNGLSIIDINGNCIYENLEIQASTTQRVIMSTIGFLKGLCPNNFQEIIKRYFNEYYAKYSTNIEAWNQIMSSDFQNPLELELHYFERPNDFMFHGHKKSICPAIKDLKKKIESSEYFKSKEEEFKNRPEFDEVFDIIKAAYPSKSFKKKSITLSDIQDIFDDYQSNHAQGFLFPNPSQSAIQYMQEVVRFLRYYEDNCDSLEHFAQLTEPFKWIISQLYSTTPLSWYSGHDTNQVAILSAISDFQPIIPFASQLEIIVKNEIVMVYYNRQQIQTKFCTDGYFCTREQTVNYLMQFIHPNLNSLCGLEIII
ncbi:unnamed protein product [Paramecium octaurelia]|uniref:Acid phosphatase n=1 Tax=Paramecium octaurelia TaxID=43137 RepID=A0A8S1SVS6_PAROT|nr:unnamed protein product [Paramecium octaurelia]